MSGHSSTFPAMGGSATLVVEGDAGLLALGRRRIEDLERKWSRFLPTSEVSRANADRHRAHSVSADTRLLCHKASVAWTATGGAYDPSVLDALVAWGDGGDRTATFVSTPSGIGPAPGLAAMEVDDAAGTVRLRVGFDPGGIGKGLAADLVATELVAAGARSAIASLSGDLRVAGDAPPGGWSIGIEDPAEPERDLLAAALTGGGLATSSDRRRRWTVPGDDGPVAAHHLIDPRRGRPADLTLEGVTVLAGEAWWAEALTKAVLVGGLPVEDLPAHGASGIGRTRDGDVVGTPDLVGLLGSAA